MSYKHNNLEHIIEQIHNLYHDLDTINNQIKSLTEKIKSHISNISSEDKTKKKNKDYHIFEKQYKELQQKRLHIHSELIKYNNQKEKVYNNLKTNMSVSTDDIYLCKSSTIKQHV